MAVTATHTARQIVTDALLDIEALTMGQTIPGPQADHALRVLNRLLKSWQIMDGAPDFLRATQTVTATTSAAHTMSPVRPLRILSVNMVNASSVEIPMNEMTRDEYKALTSKTTTGTPTQYYYDRQRESALLYVWPVFSAVTTETFKVDYEREFEDLTDLDDVLDLPVEWHDTAVLQLAARLAPAYGSESAKIRTAMEAERSLARALGASVANESVFFGAGRA